MRTRRRVLGTVLACIAAVALAAFAFQATSTRSGLASAAVQQSSQFSLDPDTLVGWYEGPAQPIFFSHRRHAGVHKIDCLYCHSNTDKSQVAPMPSVDLCFGCHRVVKAASTEIQRLRGYQQDSQPIPWVRIYKLADFVQFNHSRHIRAEVKCQDCHGKVEETDVLYKWAPLTMGWCLDCHREPTEDEAKLAAARRNTQKFRNPSRESHGLYPRSISSWYGITKAPIDCAACHY